MPALRCADKGGCRGKTHKEEGEMRAVKLNHVGMLVVAAVVLAVIGCSSSGKSDLASLNGAWQNPSKQEKVVFNLNGKSNTVVIGDKTLPVTIKPVEADSFILHVSDAASGGKEWKLVRIWSDNGETFALRFEHDGQTDNLERVKG
jgi:hypothetical protein